jgi:hypothetical protein
MANEPESCVLHPGTAVEFWHRGKQSLGCGRCLLESGEPLGSWVLIEEALPKESSALADGLECALASKPQNVEHLIEVVDGLPEDTLTASDRAEYLRILHAARDVSEQMSSAMNALRLVARTQNDV